ncbi:MAG: RAMP superfamily CRISPR-associated protein [Jaaginema sp. PMC 1079.18]|nr:RAMP superfamily CRISPR-associated protein [Jaaginema sp. PMC 1080.18]MEC4849734.1 RAMP superfamily CRISPR-associated protein [Jaaginema sp. PMC 1079.18]MEC4867704.1 RAMP superfamily CRISPR-associated protein [Jaaginema sp. PMC 1078.18]
MINLQNLSTATETLTLTAIIDTALCVGAGGSSGSLADKPIVRTKDRKLLIPASQLKGRLRHECEKIARGLEWPICESPTAEKMCPQRKDLSDDFHIPQYDLTDWLQHQGYEGISENRKYHCLACQIFGNPMIPSRLDFSDLICSEPQENLPEVLRPGVTINRRRQTAEDQKLYFLETSPASLKLAFIGTIQISPNAPSQTKPLILAALQHINALGGSKSTGLGWLTWEIEPSEINNLEWDELLK